MKNWLTGFVLIATAQLLCAQTQKGNGLISGTASVNASWVRPGSIGSKATVLLPALNLTAGRFVADNWLAGLSVSGSLVLVRSNSFVANNPSFNPRENRITNPVVTTTPFVRRYFAIGPALAFAGGGLSVGVNGERRYTREGSQLITDQRSVNWSVNPYLEAGINYFVSNRLAIQLSATASSVPVNVGTLGLGLVYWTGENQKNGPLEPRDNPQTNLGNWLIEGGFSATGTSTDELRSSSRQTTYQLSPSVGYFVGKNALLGLSLPMTYSRFDGSYGWTVGIAPYYQHYWTSTRLTPYTRAGLDYTVYGQEFSDIRTRTLGADVSIGLAYMAGKRFILETSLVSASFSRFQTDGVNSGNAQWNAGLSAGLRGNFAVRYVLTRPR